MAKLNPAGSALSYATFLGGSNDETGYGIAVDGSGNVNVAGDTNSSDFPTSPGAYDTTYNGGLSDVFVVKFSFPPAELPRTGQTTCYGSAGAVIPCTGTGQDGEIQAGVPWPDPRFTDNGDGTVSDNLTGLMWTTDGNAPGPSVCSPATTKTWQGALDYVACLNINSYLGYTDWRLPNVNEHESLINAEQPNSSTWLNTQGFSNVQSDYYWSSTSYADGTDGGWIVDMWSAGVGAVSKSSTNYPVWSVRSGQVGAIGSTEICDGIDNDLDGFIDEGFTDTDNDGQADCVDSDDDNDGYSDTAEIAADSDPLNAASTPEVCDGIDNDMDGLTDEWLTRQTICGVGVCAGNTGVETCTGGVWGGDTCDPYGGASAEACDGVDNDCDSIVDEGVQNTYYSDADNDTYGNASVTTQACTQSSGYVSDNTDCDDGDANIYPGAVEIPNDGIDQDCNGFDLAFEILLNAAIGNQQSQTVAWNDMDKEYLVLWQDFRNGVSNPDIYGARLDKNGNVIAGNLPVITQTAKQAGPWVSYGGGGYVAVWIDQRTSGTTGTDVYGAWILPDGSVSSEFVVTNASANQRAASVVYNPSLNNFLVTWTDETNGANNVDVWGAIVNPGGSVSSGPFAMVTASRNQRGPYVRYDYRNSQYFMVWFDNRSGNNDIYGSRVNSSGGLLDGSGLVISNASGNQNNPRITDRRPADGISNFVLSWIDLRNGQADIYGALIDEFGTKIGSDIQIAGGSYDQRAASIDVDYIRTGQAVVSWIDKRNGTDYDIYRAQVDQSGLVSGEALVAGAATGAANNQQGPLVTYSDDAGADNGFLMLWRDNRSGIDYDMYGIKVWP